MRCIRFLFYSALVPHLPVFLLFLFSLSEISYIENYVSRMMHGFPQQCHISTEWWQNGRITSLQKHVGWVPSLTKDSASTKSNVWYHWKCEDYKPFCFWNMLHVKDLSEAQCAKQLKIFSRKNLLFPGCFGIINVENGTLLTGLYPFVSEIRSLLS